MTARSEDRYEDVPTALQGSVLPALLGFAALLGFSGSISLLKILFATNTFWRPWAWQTALVVAWNALIGVGAIESPGIAIFAITTWLLATAVEWWWYFSADEHERKAADFASIVGRGAFTTVTLAWWVATRAGLLPQLDAMVLWVIVMGISAIAWVWHRNR